MKFWPQVFEFARRDLVAERRAGEVVAIVIPFGAVALMTFPLALGIDSAVISRVGPAMFWVVSLLFAMQIALRHSAADRPEHRAMLSLLILKAIDWSIGLRVDEEQEQVGLDLALHEERAYNLS